VILGVQIVTYLAAFPLGPTFLFTFLFVSIADFVIVYLGLRAARRVWLKIFRRS